MRRFVVAMLLGGGWLAALAAPAAAQTTLHDDYRGTWLGEVVEVLDSQNELVPGTTVTHSYQTITAEVLDGPLAGQTITIENDFLGLKPGQRFYFNHYEYIDGGTDYGVVQRDRRWPLAFLGLLFIIGVVALGRWQGVRALIALVGSLAAIYFVLLPAIIAGWNPVLVSSVIAAIVLFGAIFFTHGFNRESTVAYVGTMLAVLLTSLLALFAVTITSLTGFADDSATYLNLSTNGTIDFTALLLGAIIIGVLGVLDDIAITQAAVVTELYTSNRTLSSRTVFSKALRVGREHAGALVNTLILAYVGVSLPLILQFYIAASSVSMTLSNEIIATEIVRAIIGSLGLIMTVPIVTALAVFYLKDYTPKHSHGHSHTHYHH